MLSIKVPLLLQVAEKVGVPAGMGVATAWLTAYATGKQQINEKKVKKKDLRKCKEMESQGKKREGKREGNVEEVE